MHDHLRRIDAGGIAGDVVECGVWRGGHIILTRLVAPARVCWLFDTFAGMTAPGPHDFRRNRRKPPPDKALNKNWTMATRAEVIENLRAHDLYDDRKLKFVVGDVCTTLRQPENVPAAIALLRLDTDWFESTKIELHVLWPRLVKGGTLIVDDFGHWMGARKAVKEFFAACVPDYKKRLIPIDYTAVALVK